MIYKMSKQDWLAIGCAAGWLKEAGFADNPELAKAWIDFQQFLAKKGLNGFRINMRCDIEEEKMQGMSDEQRIEHLQKLIGVKPQLPV